VGPEDLIGELGLDGSSYSGYTSAPTKDSTKQQPLTRIKTR
jgi:hypothetical protein